VLDDEAVEVDCMNPGIFLIQNNEELVEMNEQPYDSEKLLQSWLAKYPALLVGNQIDAKEPRRWLFIEQECAVPSEEGGAGRWAIDNLFLDQDAIPTIVEVKRSTDTRIRREVVGQMLDYAANALEHWPIAHIRERFAANCKSAGVEPEERLREFLEEEMEPEEFWQKAERNLKERRLRLLFVADKIPTELQSIVEFLNEQMDKTEVLAIEIKQFVGEHGLRSLVPRVVGQTAKAQEQKSNGKRSTKTEEEFFEELEKRSPTDASVARKILDWSRKNFSQVNWKGASFVPVLDYGADFSHNPITVFVGGKVPRVGIKFGRLKKRNGMPDEKRIELLRRLNAIPGVSLSMDNVDKYPNILLSTLANEDALEQFLQTVAWTNEEVKAAKK
jgi:hypothetical protein